MNRRGFVATLAALPFALRLSKRWKRPEWRPAHAKRVWRGDDAPAAKIVVDPFCPLGWIAVYGGVAFVNPKDRPPWPPDTSFAVRDRAFAAWTMPT